MSVDCMAWHGVGAAEDGTGIFMMNFMRYDSCRRHDKAADVNWQ